MIRRIVSLSSFRRLVPGLLLLLLLLPGGPLTARGESHHRSHFEGARLKEINQVLTEAVQRREIPGAVVLLDRGGKRWGNSYGCRSIDPEIRPMVPETIFDAASLTKVMATAPAVLLLVEDGKLDLDAPASRWLPEFTGEGKEKITLLQLLTHTSGLRAGIGGGWEGYAAGVSKAMAEPVGTPAGTEFRYSDINFILLGEVVSRAAGESLDAFTQRRLYQPLGMEDTRYCPPAAKKDRIAPTTREAGAVIQGVVHDPTARRMGGIAGHAGLFTTLRDTGRFCRMLLNEGSTPDGRVVLKPGTVRALTEVRPVLPGGVLRTAGFDVLSSYSGPKGVHFGPRSFGHTGFTGTCFWIDPDADAYYVLLTNRNHPDERGSVGTTRWQVSNLAAEAMGVAKPVKSGADVIAAKGMKELEGKKIGLITNHTGLTSDGGTTLAALQKIPGAKVVKLFSPEHGIGGALDHEKITDGTDGASGLPVISLYGARRKPDAETLAGVEVLVFDIQDIGTRFYTYISTMLKCMEAASEHKLPFVVLDRVNPLGGSVVEGPLPREVKNTFVACHDIPLRHGLTVGELARLLAKERLPDVKLTVVLLEGWERRFLFSHTLSPWTNPSPNMRSPEAALLYPGIGMLEFTNLSVGRGTDLPFKYLGAPWVNPEALVRRLQAARIPGLRVEAAEFKPVSREFANELCRGIQLSVTDPRVFESSRLGIIIAQALLEEHGDVFKIDEIQTLLCHPPTLEAIRAKKPLKDIFQSWKADEAAFRERCKSILLYPEAPAP